MTQPSSPPALPLPHPIVSLAVNVRALLANGQTVERDFAITFKGETAEPAPVPTAPTLRLTGALVEVIPSGPVAGSGETEVAVGTVSEGFFTPLFQSVVPGGTPAAALATGLVADGRTFFARQRKRTGSGWSNWSETGPGLPTSAELDVLVDFTGGVVRNAGAPQATVEEAFGRGLLSVVRASRAAGVTAGGEMRIAGPDEPALVPGVGLHVVSGTPLRNHLPSALDAPAGVLPTGWWIGNSTGLEVGVAGSGHDKGIPYVDVRLAGTAVAGTLQIAFQPAKSVPALQGETWTASVCARLVAGTLGNISYRHLRCIALNGWTVLGSKDVTLALDEAGLWRSRTVSTHAIAAGNTSNVEARLAIGTVAGPVDATLRIALPQLERAASASQMPILDGERATDRLVVTWPGKGRSLLLALSNDGETKAFDFSDPSEGVAITGLPGERMVRSVLLRDVAARFSPSDPRLSWRSA